MEICRCLPFDASGTLLYSRNQKNIQGPFFRCQSCLQTHPAGCSLHALTFPTLSRSSEESLLGSPQSKKPRNPPEPLENLSLPGEILALHCQASRYPRFLPPPGKQNTIFKLQKIA